ncbi:MAG: hypothetical protein JJE07_11420 [Flavobacteriaceae bacterium]|nr:hypothetical protein [Flavobacteriaceae bacterium]
MELSLFFVILGIGIIVVILSQVFSKKARIKRKLKKAELKKIANFKNGDIAKIVGYVEIIGDPLIAPLSGRECAVYSIHVKERVSAGKSTRWITRIEDELTTKFVIKDGEHYAYVNDKNINCYIVDDQNYASGFMNDPDKNLEQYLNKKGYNSKGAIGFNRTFRYREGVLEKGEEIAVFGKGEWKDAATLGLPEKYNKVLEITSGNTEAVFLSDDTTTTKKRTIQKKARARYNEMERRYRKE